MERLGDSHATSSRASAPQGGMPELLAAWPEAVGPMVAANAWPARIARDGTLHVNTSSSAWAFELGQLAPTILERLSEKLGESAPKALRFAVGHLPEPAVGGAWRGPDSRFPSRPRKPCNGRPSWPPGSRTRSCENGSQRAAALGLSTAPVRPPFLIHCTAARK